jgi:uncharacterized membrane protein
MNASARRSLRIVVAAAGLMPWLLAMLRARSATFVAVFHTLCHQRPERTLVLFGEPMLVCSRCAGLYAGLFAGVLLPLPQRWLHRGRTLVLAAFAITLLEIALQDFGPHAPWHETRLLTGFALGWTVTAFFAAAALREPVRPTTRAPHEYAST